MLDKIKGCNLLRRVPYAFLLILSSFEGHSQLDLQNTIHAQWRLNHLTVDQGLSNSFVHSIARDQEGYIWISTSYGLNRFNGIEVIKYFHNPADSLSIRSNYVPRVFVDSRNRVWVGSDRDIQYFDDKMEVFRSIKIPDGMSQREVFCIEEDATGNILIGTSLGMFQFSYSTETIIPYPLERFNVPRDSIYRILMDHNDNLWVSRFRNGLYHLNTKDSTTRHYLPISGDEHSLSGDNVYHMLLDSKDQLWVGTYDNGISRFDPENNSFVRYEVDPKVPFTARVRTVFEDPGGNLYAGTRLGLYRYNKQASSFEVYSDENHPITELSQNSVTCSLVDDYGNVWLGTHSGGVSYTNVYQNKFITYGHLPNNQQFLSNRSVHCFDSYGDKLYVGTERGLDVLNIKTGDFTYLKHDPEDPYSISYNDTKSLAAQTADSIWIASNRGGLNLLNARNKVVRRFMHDPNDPYSLPSSKLYHVHVDNHGALWVLSNDDWDRNVMTASRYDRKTNRFHHYYHDFFLCIIENPDGPMLIGGSYGFYEYDRENDQFIEYRNDSLVYRTQSVYHDKNDDVWLGARTGLIKYERSEGKFFDYSDKFGVHIREVFGILEDGDDLWVSTNDGLLHIRDLYDDPSVRRFRQKDGLQSREFNYNAYHKSDDGQFFFGGDQGFNVFYPDSISDNPVLPQINLSGLTVRGEGVRPGMEVNGRVILKKSIGKTDKITLPYDVGSFALEYDVIHYGAATANQCRYILHGAEDNWHTANAFDNRITYHKLSPGKYTLELYASNADGLINPDSLRLDIEILKPFWSLTWFRILLLIIVSAGALLIHRYRTYRLVKQKALLSNLVNERTKELRDEREQLEKMIGKLVESEKLASLGTFTAGIAHEINNPLNYISGSATLLFDSIKELFSKAPKMFSETDLMEFNKKELMLNKGISRISHLIGSLKNYSRQDREFVRTNLIECLDDAINIVANRISPDVIINREHKADVTIECMPTSLSQVFINLLENANDAMDGTGDLYISVTQNKTTVEVKVRDTGKGIEQHNIKRLFDPFFTTKSAGKGTGLGLYVSHGFISRHGGSISVESTPGVGSEFTVQLPISQTSPRQKDKEPISPAAN